MNRNVNILFFFVIFAASIVLMLVLYRDPKLLLDLAALPFC